MQRGAEKRDTRGSGLAWMLLVLAMVVAMVGCRRPPSESPAPVEAEAPAWMQPASVTLPAGNAASAVRWLEAQAVTFDDAREEELVERAAGHRLVLLGESTHGTSEFYAQRASMTRRMIEAGGVDFVAVEGDWSALSLLDSYARGEVPAGEATSAAEIMRSFHRWPEWMWANTDFAEFVEWLREHNATADVPVRLYGVDVYDAGASLQRMVEIVGEDAQAPCLLAHRGDFRSYGQSLRQGGVSCADEARALVEALRGPALDEGAGEQEREAWMNAKVVAAAEAHHRAMFTAEDASSWNTRAGFFFTAVEALLRAHGEDSRAVFWAHNTHIGDARATDMQRIGQVNMGQLARERLGEETFAIGFAKVEGQVMAGRRWGAAPEVMPVAAPGEGTWDALLAQVDVPRPWVVMFRGTEPPASLRQVLPQRAIGVVFQPEGGGAWVPTRLSDRYDALVLFGEGRPLEAIR